MKKGGRLGGERERRRAKDIWTTLAWFEERKIRGKPDGGGAIWRKRGSGHGQRKTFETENEQKAGTRGGRNLIIRRRKAGECSLKRTSRRNGQGFGKENEHA